MKKVFIVLLAASLFSLTANGNETPSVDPIANEEASLAELKDHPRWNHVVQEKYQISAEDMASLKEQGLSDAQIAIAAHLASASDKTISDVASMRVEQKKGWGEIAKELGVHPKEIGKANSSLRKALSEDSRAEKMEKKADRKMAKKEQKLEKKMEKKMEKKNAKSKDKSSH